jgi:hypothetical protein
MPAFKAYFQEYKKRKIVSLIFVVVSRLVKDQKSCLAYAYEPDTDKMYKFWVSKKDQPLGSRCRVYSRKQDMYPTISRNKSGFEVKEGTVVLLERPNGGSAAFPVISWEEYQQAKDKMGTEFLEPTDVTKGAHRWVEAPPFHPQQKRPL